MMKKTSYINGKALVVFGGAINISIGYNPNEKVVGLGLSELKEQVNVGEKLSGNEEMYEPQIEFIFGSIESINVFYSALAIAERTLKDGKIPQIGGEK